MWGGGVAPVPPPQAPGTPQGSARRPPQGGFVPFCAWFGRLGGEPRVLVLCQPLGVVGVCVWGGAAAAPGPPGATVGFPGFGTGRAELGVGLGVVAGRVFGGRGAARRGLSSARPPPARGS